VRCSMTRTLPLRPGTALTVSSVAGVARAGQMRRDFLTYVERERAHPYRTFLHYNSWYDIGYFSRYDEAAALAAITAFGTELHEKRGVTLDSFLFDDGWDDPKTLWHFNPGFPAGFTNVAEATHRYGAAPGVWMSPWGGYGEPRQERIKYGKAQGFETNEDGFALSGPVYYKHFRDTCLDMMHRYGVNQFKFDGTGNSSSTFPGSPFDSDFDAAIHLIDELRAEKPDLYVNLTTGTYPSPFWLRYADSIWRGGDDHEFAGIGTSRQRWITYRDADTYEHVVRAGALYPLNSLMLHGMIYARSAHNLMTDPGNDFSSEVRSYFGTGTQLQEMYITPTLLSRDNWDTIAESARWSRANADTLVDTHWVGGDPLRLEPYGWASWSPRKGILTLRNPSNVPQKIAIDVERVFELPPDAPRRYSASSPWAADRGRAAVELRAGEEREIRLAPFEVLTLEAGSGRREEGSGGSGRREEGSGKREAKP
ncbi:MAG: enterotoxin, partial [Gemmatimonadaceae bacterium]